MMYPSKTRGFSLIELIIVIVLMGIISAVVGRILFQAFKNYTVSQNISDVDWNAFLAMQVFTNDVHDIRSANDISTISATSFSFVDIAGNTVTYQLTGSTLTRNSQTLARGLSSLAFGYRDGNYAVTATPANVRYITFAGTYVQNNLSLPFTTMVGTRGMS